MQSERSLSHETSALPGSEADALKKAALAASPLSDAVSCWVAPR